MVGRVARWLGVDVGARRKGFDIAVVDDRRLLALAGGLDREAVVERVDMERPTIVAIDSPRRCAPDGQTTRADERRLARTICGIRWTPDQRRVRASAYYSTGRDRRRRDGAPALAGRDREDRRHHRAGRSLVTTIRPAGPGDGVDWPGVMQWQG
jgi:hypothetical protein